MSNQQIISLDSVSFSYGSSREKVLDNVTLSIGKGEFVALIGANGSGKSTLAKHFNGILAPSEGRVLINGMDTADEEHLFDIRRTVGMVFQNPDNQIVATVVEEDVAFALENLGVEPSEIRIRVDEALEAVGMTKHRTDMPHKLSGGQKQRVAIAGILAMQPDCIVLDEPTAMLDPKGRKRVMETILRLNRENGITVVLITHFMEDAALADRVVVMRRGRVAIDGTPQEVFSDIARIRSLGLDVPQATELYELLKKDGIKLQGGVVTSEECIARLARLLEGK